MSCGCALMLLNHAFSGAPAFYRNVPTNKDAQEKLWQDMLYE